MSRRVSLAALVVVLLSLVSAPDAAAILPAPSAPQNPFLAPTPSSNIHDDTWMSDAYARSGPVGPRLSSQLGAMPPSLCGSLTFDSRGRILTVCPSLGAAPQARVIDPVTLAITARLDLPAAADPPGTKGFQNFSGGGYFFLDAKDRIWTATKTNRLVVLRVTADGTAIIKVADYDLTGVLRTDERISSALPDFTGRIWFVSKQGGKVGVLDTRRRRVRVLRTGESIQNSFAVDRRGVYVVSDKRLYRLWAGADGRPFVQWKLTYDDSGVVKPGQAEAGSGTTPTVMPGGYVSITDNAAAMQVVVVRRAVALSGGHRRVVCEVPVFGPGAGATENSLISVGRSLWVENNFGYRDPFGAQAGTLTEPGFARVDVRADGTGCIKRWETREQRAPSVVAKLSTATGLIYSYVQDADPLGGTRWSWVGIDAETGRTAFKQLAGRGPSFNNNYAGLALGKDGSAYLGTIGGVVALRQG